MIQTRILLPSLRYLAAGLAMGLLGANVQANGPAARQYLVAKGVSFVQTWAGVPVLNTNESNEPYQAMANVDPVSPASITSASVLIHGGATWTLATNDFDSEWKTSRSFSTKAALDAAAPAGAYKFTIVGSDGTNTPTLTLSADHYPNAPHIANWSALQSADASGEIVVTWNAFTGGTTNDFVEFRIEDDMGTVFSSGENPGQPRALNGTSNSIVIPAGTLMASSNYFGALLFARINLNTNAYPGVQGIAAHFKETTFSLSTTSAPPAAGRFRFAQAAYSVNEIDQVITLTVRRTGGTSGSASVSVSNRAGTASPGNDYEEISTPRVLEWADGEDVVQGVSIIIAPHSTLDGDKTFFVTLSNPTGDADLGFPAEATVTILDNEVRTAGTFGFSAPMYTATETVGNVVVTITRTGGATGPVSVHYNTVGGSAMSGEDFALTEGFLDFSDGVTSHAISIPIINDGLDETNESFSVRLDFPTGHAALSPHNTATVVLKDDDTAGTLSFSAAMYPVIEADTNLAVIVRRIGGGATNVSVDLVITGGTATRGDDYDHESGDAVTLHFGPGQMAMTNSFTIHDDRAGEGDETIRLSLRNPDGGARLAGVTNATIKILDDEVTLQFSASNYTNKESAGVAVIFVERTGPLNLPASVAVRPTGGSATLFSDYIPAYVVVNFPVGAKKKPVAVRLINDFLVEDRETIVLTLESPSDNALIGPRSTATLHLLSDDRGGVIQFATANLNVSESRPFVPVMITRTGGLASNVTVHLRTSEMSASDGVDYVGTNVTLTFAARETKKTILVPVRPDTLAEGLETFMVHLSDPTGGATLGDRSEATVRILDEDVGGVIGFARPEIIVNENGTDAVVIVNRTGGAASNVKVRLTAANGTATNADYGSFDEVLIFAAGERSKTNRIRINNDTLAEGAIPETIRLTLREFEGGGRPGLSNAVIRIIDDEIPLTRAPFLSQTARPGMNTSFSRNFSVNPPTLRHAMNGSLSGTNLTITGSIAGAGELKETMKFELFGVTGPGVFNVAFPVNTANSANCTYERVAISAADSFIYGTTAYGIASGTITLDAYDGSKATGRYDLILVDDGNDTKTIHVVGSFSTTVL